MVRCRDIVTSGHCHRRIVALMMVGLVATGCGGFTRPTTQQECFDQASSSGSGGDADSIWQLAYDDAAQQVGEATLVYVCLGPDTTATVTAQAPRAYRSPR